MKTYFDMAQAARNMNEETRVRMAHCLLRIYEADRTRNNGMVNGEALLCLSFAEEAAFLLREAGVIDT